MLDRCRFVFGALRLLGRFLILGRRGDVLIKQHACCTNSSYFYNPLLPSTSGHDLLKAIEPQSDLFAQNAFPALSIQVLWIQDLMLQQQLLKQLLEGALRRTEVTELVELGQLRVDWVLELSKGHHVAQSAGKKGVIEPIAALS